MKFSLKKSLAVFLLFGFSLLIWHILPKKSAKNFTPFPSNLPQYQEDLHVFTERVHIILQALHLTHFLCYGSLWGQIRLSRLLPWEDKVVMCLLNEDVSTKDEVLVVRMFRKEGMDITYWSSEGHYVVSPLEGNPNMKVLLVVFEYDRMISMYRRVGWIRRLLPPFCDTFEMLDCFPPSVVNPPLPMREFGKTLLPVPREGIELQKYHYRDTWWKEITAKNV